MNLQDNKYNKFFLIKEMLETGEIIKRLDVRKILSYEEEVKKERIFITGEGSSRIFPAKKIMYEARKKGYKEDFYTVLCSYNPELRVVAVEPAESPVLSGGEQGAHKIEGIGLGFIPPLWKASIADEIVTVSTEEAKSMARQSTSYEALFAGTSSGANVVAAIRVAKRLGPGYTVVTLLVDSGLKYLTTDLYTSS